MGAKMGNQDSAMGKAGDAEPGMMDNAGKSFRSMTGTKTEEEKNCEDKCNDACPLSLMQRLIATVICWCFGFFISLLAWLRFTDCTVDGDCAPFGILFSCGTLISISSSLFMWGPITQAFAMFERVRICATVTFLIAIISTIVVAAIPEMESGTRAGLVVILCLTQYVTSIWYTLTWIKLPMWEYTLADMICEKICG